MRGLIVVAVFLALKVFIAILSKYLDTSSSNDKINNKICINYGYGHLFNTKYNYLCMNNILRIYDEGVINKDYYLLGFVYGYLLAAKDAVSQSYYSCGDEETAEKIAHLPFNDLLKYIDICFINTNKDERPIFDVIKTFIPTLQMQAEYDKNFYMMTIEMLYENYMKLENKFSIGTIDGYVHSAKEWILRYMSLDEKSQIKIAEFDNIVDAQSYILSNIELLKTMSNMVAQPIVTKAILHHLL